MRPKLRCIYCDTEYRLNFANRSTKDHCGQQDCIDSHHRVTDERNRSQSRFRKRAQKMLAAS